MTYTTPFLHPWKRPNKKKKMCEEGCKAFGFWNQGMPPFHGGSGIYTTVMLRE
jgi:hypothetical protein